MTGLSLEQGDCQDVYRGLCQYARALRARRTCWACNAPSWTSPARARSRQLKPEEVQGGTFSITNFGSFGSLMGTPIINQPQVAILGVGTVDKTPVVIDDAIAIRSICHLSLSFDHRLIDGALADQLWNGAARRYSSAGPGSGCKYSASVLCRIRQEQSCQ